eukprot:6495400-Pyramimonas_sp.AAC.1
MSTQTRNVTRRPRRNAARLPALRPPAQVLVAAPRAHPGLGLRAASACTAAAAVPAARSHGAPRCAARLLSESRTSKIAGLKARTPSRSEAAPKDSRSSG